MCNAVQVCTVEEVHSSTQTNRTQLRWPLIHSRPIWRPAVELFLLFSKKNPYLLVLMATFLSTPSLPKRIFPDIRYDGKDTYVWVILRTSLLMIRSMWNISVTIWKYSCVIHWQCLMYMCRHCNALVMYWAAFLELGLAKCKFDHFLLLSVVAYLMYDCIHCIF